MLSSRAIASAAFRSSPVIITGVMPSARSSAMASFAPLFQSAGNRAEGARAQYDPTADMDSKAIRSPRRRAKALLATR
jgi:hypothetical protein